MLKAVLFDLDGTLLPMDQEEFVRRYLELLCRKMAPYGYEPQPLIKAIWDGTGAMVKNDGSCTNEEAFWRHFLGVYGESAREHVPLFEEFYAVEFQQARDFCGFTPRAAEILALVKERGLRPILATNPLFPAVATGSRARWAGLEPEDFALITTYENSRFCKPDPAYYREILKGQILLPAVSWPALQNRHQAAVPVSVFLRIRGGTRYEAKETCSCRPYGSSSWNSGILCRECSGSRRDDPVYLGRNVPAGGSGWFYRGDRDKDHLFQF